MRYQPLNIALGIAAFAWLPLVAGCGHPSAASTVKEPTAAAIDERASEPVVQAETPTPPAADHNAVATAPQAPGGEPTKPKPPPADRTPRRPGEAEKITFDDLNLGMQADMVFRDFMLSDRVKDLDGKKISIVGYMHGGSDSQRGIKQFILLKNTQCKFGPGGQADHLADVQLREGQSTNFTPSDMKIEGTFRIQPFQGTDGNTWSIYRLEDAQIR